MPKTLGHIIYAASGLAMLITGFLFFPYGSVVLIFPGVFMTMYAFAYHIGRVIKSDGSRKIFFIACHVIVSPFIVFGILGTFYGILMNYLALVFGIAALVFCVTAGIAVFCAQRKVAKIAHNKGNNQTKHKGDDKNGPKNPKTGAESR